jgi:CRISPR-associated protein Cas6
VIKIKEAQGRELEPDVFMIALTKQLRNLDIDALAELEFSPCNERGPFARRVLKVKNAVLPGYGVILRQLSERDSLLIQRFGLGGRRRMGCGLFLPLKREG